MDKTSTWFEVCECMASNPDWDDSFTSMGVSLPFFGPAMKLSSIVEKLQQNNPDAKEQADFFKQLKRFEGSKYEGIIERFTSQLRGGEKRSYAQNKNHSNNWASQDRDLAKLLNQITDHLEQYHKLTSEKSVNKGLTK